MTTTVTGKLKGIGDTEADPEASVDIALCGYGSHSPVARGTGSEAGVFYATEIKNIVPSLPGNAFTVNLTGNDLIEPPGTYYVVFFKDSNGDILQCNAYVFLDGNTYDLTNTDPFDPTQPPPPLPPLIFSQLLVVPWSDAPVFPGDQFTAFQITLAGDTEGATVANILQGNLYTFIIVQDAVGNHIFFWPGGAAPSGIRNPAIPVCPLPNSVTVQTFVAINTTILLPIGPATYYTP